MKKRILPSLLFQRLSSFRLLSESHGRGWDDDLFWHHLFWWGGNLIE
jgi:hypothetical protein